MSSAAAFFLTFCPAAVVNLSWHFCVQRGMLGEDGWEGEGSVVSSTCAPAPRPGVTPGFLDPACRATRKCQAFFVEIAPPPADDDSAPPPRHAVRARPEARTARPKRQPPRSNTTTARKPHARSLTINSTARLPHRSSPAAKPKQQHQQRDGNQFFVDVRVPKSGPAHRTATSSPPLRSPRSGTADQLASDTARSSPEAKQRPKTASSFPQHSIHVGTRRGSSTTAAKQHASPSSPERLLRSQQRAAAAQSGVGSWRRFASTMSPVATDGRDPSDDTLADTHIFDIHAHGTESPPALHPGTADNSSPARAATAPQQSAGRCADSHAEPEASETPTRGHSLSASLAPTLSRDEASARQPEQQHSFRHTESVSSASSCSRAIESSLRDLQDDLQALQDSSDPAFPLNAPSCFASHNATKDALHRRPSQGSAGANQGELRVAPRSRQQAAQYASAAPDTAPSQPQKLQGVSEYSSGSVGSGSPVALPSEMSDATTVVSQSFASSSGAVHPGPPGVVSGAPLHSEPQRQQRRATTDDAHSTRPSTHDPPSNRRWSQLLGSWKDYAKMAREDGGVGASQSSEEGSRRFTLSVEQLRSEKVRAKDGAAGKSARKATTQDERDMHGNAPPLSELAKALEDDNKLPLEALMNTLRKQLDAVQQASGATSNTDASVDNSHSYDAATRSTGAGGQGSTDVREGRTPSMRASQRGSVVLRESIAMPAVPEDAPMETPLREFLERTGGAGVGNLRVPAPPEWPPVEGPTAAGSSSRKGSASRVLQWTGVGQSTEAESATTVFSEGPDGDGGVAVSQSQGSTSFVQSSQDLGGVFSSMQGDDHGLFAFGSVSIGSHGTTLGSGGDHGGGGGLLESGSSVLAPTFRPDSKRTDSSIILSESSINSDAGNPLITPKKKQRCCVPVILALIILDISFVLTTCFHVPQCHCHAAVGDYDSCSMRMFGFLISDSRAGLHNMCPSVATMLCVVLQVFIKPESNSRTQCAS